MKKKTLRTTIIASALALALQLPAFASATSVYTVKKGDTLWKLATENGITVSQLKQYNGQTSDTIYIGQKLTLAPATKYTVVKGDTLWAIAKKYGSTISEIKSYNNLTSDLIKIGQVLYIPKSSGSTSGGTSSSSTSPNAVTSWPSITYIVKAGDTVYGIAKKFGVSQADILKYNYMTASDWLDAGDKIAINGYAPRNYAVTPGESSAPAKVGKIVDWFLDGQYLIKRNDVFTITDVKTGLSFKVKMMGGYNHADVEPVTATDTATMKKIFSTWAWAPRPVVIYHQGINFAASLSGMPHSADTISTNNVTGHFDLYLSNSTSHSSTTSKTYIQQHATAVKQAAGLK